MNRPEPVSSPMSANAPLVSNADGPSDHRAFTKGVNDVTRVTVGKTAASNSGKKKVKKPKTRKVGR
jgi:hypothetical protein